MTLQQDIDNIKSRMGRIAEKFNALQRSRTNSSAKTPLPDIQKAVQGLRTLSCKRADIINAEIDQLVKASHATHERISLTLRFRPRIFGADADAAASQITNDLNDCAMNGNLGANFVYALASFNPALRDDAAEKIQVSLNETTRIIDGIRAGVMTQAEVTEFHKIYETPDNPLLSYNQKTGELAHIMVQLVEKSADRIENTMDYVGYIDDVIIPTFPDHATGMKAQADQMMEENNGSFERASTLLQKAEIYKAEMK